MLFFSQSLWPVISMPATQDAMQRGWEILEFADPMFWYIILTIVGASFGVTTMNKFKKK